MRNLSFVTSPPFPVTRQSEGLMKRKTVGRKILLSMTAGLMLVGAACGSDSDSSSSDTTSVANANAATASKDTVKVGVLQSLSGTMSISEVAVKNSEMLAI